MEQHIDIAIIGTGPTGIYTFAELIRTPQPLNITLFEKGENAGVGAPYSPESATREMLANIASIEIPPLVTTYLDWLRTRAVAQLARYNLTHDMLHDRLFTPRRLLGDWFRDQLLDLIAQARATGHRVTVIENAEVIDIAEWSGRFAVVTANSAVPYSFDRVVVATGHDFGQDNTPDSYFPNPWTGLIQTDIPATDVGVMGTSLSAIDATLAVVSQHGDFRRTDDGDLVFEGAPERLRVTLMSRNGLLPEADFYCPIPYEPLQIMTAPALAFAVKQASPLDAVFDLFREELQAVDPDWCARVHLDRLNADTFADAYFADRAVADPFRWARKNLDEVERNKRERITVPWRYAILRMHEAVGEIVGELPDGDAQRFAEGLKRVFIDNYAAVPSESIRRLLALREAGILSIKAIGDDYNMQVGEDATVITTDGRAHRFPVFIDARGQSPLTTEDLPFPTLRQTLLDAGQEVPEVARDYSLTAPDSHAGRVFLGAIPYLMHDHPFVQGITASAEIGKAIAQGCLATTGRDPRRRSLTA